MNNVRFVIQISKGLIRESHARRTLMFYNVLAVLVLIFFGATFLWTWLREHPLFFVGYWGLCVWLTVLSMLLALYDIARVRLDARRARRELEEECLRAKREEDSHDSDTP